MNQNFKKIAFYLAVPLVTGGLAALLAGGMADYQALTLPPLSPPGWVFPVVWTILYLFMGCAAYRVATSGAAEQQKRQALIFYGLQLLCNFLWPMVFFRWQAYSAAFVVLLILWIFIAITTWRFSKIDERAGDLLIPYLIWVTFAGYLNLGVSLLN